MFANKVPLECVPNSYGSLFPSAGFFGASENLALSIGLNAKITGLRIYIDEDYPTYLNLHSIEILGRDGDEITDKVSRTEEMSSTYGEETVTPALTQGRGIHSSEEIRPWWRLSFDAPVEISVIRIFNRRDTWGRRSRHLVLEIANSAHDDFREVYRNQCVGCPTEFLVDMAKRGLLQPHEPACSIDELRLGWINRIVLAVASRTLNLNEISWTGLLPLVTIWERKALSDLELKFLSLFLLAQHQLGDDFSVSYITAPLYSAKQVSRLVENLNHMAQQLGLGRFMITRHGLQPEGKLRSNRAAFLQAANNAISILEKAGLKPSLAYGTLLGAARDGDLIAHDDDLDLLCEIKASSFATARTEMLGLMQGLSNNGFVCNFSTSNALNVHAYSTATGVLIDIFPYWTEGEFAFLHMERMNIRSIDARILSERTSMNLCDISFPAFAEWRKFLAERYGPTWETPQVYFEWPWTLVEEE